MEPGTQVTVSQVRWGVFLLVFALASPVLASGQTGSPDNREEVPNHLRKTPEEEASLKRRQAFLKAYGHRIEAPLKMTAAELRQVIAQPFPDDVPISKFLKFPTYEYVLSTFGLFDGNYHFDGDSDEIPYALQAEYWRRAGALKQIAGKDNGFLIEHLLSRKDKLTPTVWDGILASEWWSFEFVKPTIASPEGKTMWRQLVKGKNPVLRMMAVHWSKAWAEGAAAIDVWKTALSDEYWHTRAIALDYLAESKPTGTIEILEEFLRRKVDPTLPDEFLQKERQLNETAERFLKSREKPASQ